MKNKLLGYLGYFCGLVCGVSVSIIIALTVFPIVYIKYLLGSGKERPVLKRRRLCLVVKGIKLEII